MKIEYHYPVHPRVPWQPLTNTNSWVPLVEALLEEPQVEMVSLKYDSGSITDFRETPKPKTYTVEITEDERRQMFDYTTNVSLQRRLALRAVEVTS